MNNTNNNTNVDTYIETYNYADTHTEEIPDVTGWTASELAARFGNKRQYDFLCRHYNGILTRETILAYNSIYHLGTQQGFYRLMDHLYELTEYNFDQDPALVCGLPSSRWTMRLVPKPGPRLEIWHFTPTDDIHPDTGKYHSIEIISGRFRNGRIEFEDGRIFDDIDDIIDALL